MMVQRFGIERLRFCVLKIQQCNKERSRQSITARVAISSRLALEETLFCH
jgi:hypothetical protein